VATRKKQMFSYPYPRPSLTVDVALVTLEGMPRVLLIRRKSEPFAGCWALPGGFVDENERPIDAARRELLEETGLGQADLEQFHTFGDPGRDPRGWTVSVVYMARVKPEFHEQATMQPMSVGFRSPICRNWRSITARFLRESGFVWPIAKGRYDCYVKIPRRSEAAAGHTTASS
jgi:8-oxo-dGTP diphosphatase